MPRWGKMQTRESSSSRASNCRKRRRTIPSPRTSDGGFSRNSADGLRQFRQLGLNVEMMPKLGGHHGGKTAFNRETRKRTRWHLAEGTPPVLNRGRVEIAGAPQG